MEWYRSALAHAEAALKITPDIVGALLAVGTAHFNTAVIERREGRDSGASLDQSWAAYSKVLSRNPDHAEALSARSLVSIHRGLRLRDARQPGSGNCYRAAIKDLDRAAALNPRNANAWRSRGAAGFHLSQSRETDDPESDLEKAIAAYGKSIEANPSVAESWVGRATAFGYLGNAQRSQRIDAGPTYEKAIADCTQALKLSPALPDALYRRATSLSSWALNSGPKAVERFERAIADYDELLKGSPTHAEGWMRRGMAHWNLARVAGEADRRKHYAAAARDYEKAMSLSHQWDDVIGPNLEEARRKSEE